MDLISIFLAGMFVLVIGMIAERRKRSAAERKRAAEEEAERQAVEEYYRKLYPAVSYDVEFPNPATVSPERIADYLRTEERFGVVIKYLEIAKERQAPAPVIAMIEQKLSEMRAIIRQSFAESVE